LSFSAKNNLFLTVAVIVIAIGITMGTGSLYRFVYNYNLIMTFTLFIMTTVIFYQYFLPISSNIGINATAMNHKFSISGIILISFMLFLPLLSDIINQVPSYEIVYFYIAMLMLSFLLGKEIRENILNTYLLIIIILSILSIITLLIAIFTNYLEHLPHIQINKPFLTNFYYVSSINPSSIWFRNQSIFWEPGAFGFHLIFATLLAYKNGNKFHIATLILAGITTFSTTVFIFLILLGIYHISFGEKRLKMFIILFSIVTSITIIFIMTIDDKLIPKLFMQTLVGKFLPSSINYKSLVSRNLFTLEAIKMFLDNLFIGAGHYATSVKLEVVKSGATVNTSGLVGLLAEFGLFGVFCIFLYMRYFWRFGLIAIPITLIWLNGEFLQYSPLAIFILAHSAEEFADIALPSYSQSITKKNIGFSNTFR